MLCAPVKGAAAGSGRTDSRHVMCARNVATCGLLLGVVAVLIGAAGLSNMALKGEDLTPSQHTAGERLGSRDGMTSGRVNHGLQQVSLHGAPTHQKILTSTQQWGIAACLYIPLTSGSSLYIQCYGGIGLHCQRNCKPAWGGCYRYPSQCRLSPLRRRNKNRSRRLSNKPSGALVFTARGIANQLGEVATGTRASAG